METVRCIWPTLVAIAFVHLVSPRAVSIPEPALIFTVPVAFAAVRGGRLLGLLAASLALADVGFSPYAAGDHAARFDQDAMVRLAVTALCLPALVLLIGRFRDRMREGDDLRAEEREIAHKDGLRGILADSTSRVETEGCLPSGDAQIENVTSRKQTEQALRDCQAQYRAVIETTPDGFYVTDDDGRFLEVNDPYLRFSGYSLEELHSMRITDVEAKETAAETALHRARVRQSGSGIFESLHRTRDGRVRPVEVNASYWPGGGGRYFTFLHDITQRKMVQSALRRWADAFEHCAHGIALGDPATERVLACNPAYMRDCGGDR